MMIKRNLRLLAVAVLLAMLAGVFAACSSGTDGSEQTDPTESTVDTGSDMGGDTSESDSETQSSEQETMLDPADALILAEKGRSQFVVVVDDNASAQTRAAATDLIARIAGKSRATLKLKTDADKPAKCEILIGTMDHRTETAEAARQMNVPGGKGYRITVTDEQILIVGAEEYLGEAVKLLASAIMPCGGERFGIEKDYVGALDLPAYKDKGELYVADEGNYTYNVSNTTQKSYNEFLRELDIDGFTVHSEHEIGESSFATYYKDSIYGSQVVYASYHGAIETMRLTWGPLEYLPPVKRLSSSTVATPTITQMHLQMVDNGFTGTSNTTGAPGMSYLLQLSDGRFIVLDGGNSDATVNVAVQGSDGTWSTSGQITTADEKRLYDTMCEMMPSGQTKPTVAMWYFSHMHGDHMMLAISFLNNYAEKINLELVAYNFLNFYNFGHVKTFRSDLAKNFPDAETWIMHTGQVMHLPGCMIEVMSTPEDFVCTGEELLDANNGSVVIRITMERTSFMVLGDAYPITGAFMRDAYGEALESDILQMAHHGFEGAVMTQGFYEYIDPKICLWPCDEFRFQTDRRNIGTSSKGSNFYMNWWLRNTDWTRENGSGSRQHYTASHMTTIDAKTGQKLP